MRRRRFKKNKNKYAIFIATILIIVFTGTAYSYLNQNLNIGGQANIVGTLISSGEICSNISVSQSITSTYEQNNYNYNTIEITLTNNGNDITDWNGAFSIPEGGSISNVTNANYSITNQVVYLTSTSNSSSINENGSITITVIVITPLDYGTLDVVIYDCVEAPTSIQVNLTATLASNGWVRNSNKTYTVTYTVTLSNDSGYDIKDWTIIIALPATGFSISSCSSANYSLSGTTLTLTNISSNGTIYNSSNISFSLALIYSKQNFNLTVSSAIGNT